MLDLTIAMSCLNMTNPSIKIEYPDDAEAHFNEIRLALAPWAQHVDHHMHTYAHYNGPWIENHWNSHFESLYDTATPETCMSDLFGPFIPLFIPWVDLYVQSPYKYPQKLVETLRSVLRPGVPCRVCHNPQVPGYQRRHN